MKTTTARVYVVGAGAIARHHAAATQKLPDPERVALSVSDLNPHVLEGFKEDFPEARIFGDTREMLGEKPEPDDIVIVATPTFTHHPLASAALESGRHVLCEKPLGMNKAEALQMLALARSKDRYLGCCSTRFLGLAAGEETKRVLHKGALGALYHVTFVNRRQRGRTGIEHQPTTTWFLDSSKNGGGTLMDWSPYDFTVLNDLLGPTRVEVLSAWMANPETALHLPEGTVFDTEQHAGASLRYHLPGGEAVNVTYERAACTHGGERSVVEVEGTAGAVTWDWLDWLGPGNVTLSYDDAGEVGSKKVVFSSEDPLGFHDKPLYFFHELLNGRESHAVVNEHAVFNFLCIRAVYDCVASGQPQSVSRGDL